MADPAEDGTRNAGNPTDEQERPNVEAMSPADIEILYRRLLAHSSAHPNGCIEWVGETYRDGGHGRVRKMVGRRLLNMRAHRLAWVVAYGPVPDGLFVLHRCDNPPCWRLDHLFLGTQADNMRDMANKGRGANAFKYRTHCPAGHPYDDANTYRPPSGGRTCRTCMGQQGRLRRIRNLPVLQRMEKMVLFPEDDGWSTASVRAAKDGLLALCAEIRLLGLMVEPDA